MRTRTVVRGTGAVFEDRVVPEYCTKDGAGKLAAALVNFWRQRGAGQNLNFWLEPTVLEKRGGIVIHGIRSNLKNAMPPR